MLEHPPRPWLLAALCTAALLAAVPFVAMQISGGLTDARFPTPGGRMALTNSIAAAVVVLTWWRPAAFVGGR